MMINAFPRPPKIVARVVMVMNVITKIHTAEIATCNGGEFDGVGSVMPRAGPDRTVGGAGGEVWIVKAV